MPSEVDSPAEEPSAAEPIAFETTVMSSEEAVPVEEQVPAPPEPPPVPEQPTRPQPPVEPATKGAEIAPPDDLEGPGWAFTTSLTGPSEAGEESQQAEARRLARLLVTEIKLYNEEQVEEGRRKGNVYRELKDDIDRSRQIFEERIDKEICGEADYFHEELVRILADGDSEVLGI